MLKDLRTFNTVVLQKAIVPLLTLILTLCLKMKKRDQRTLTNISANLLEREKGLFFSGLFFPVYALVLFEIGQDGIYNEVAQRPIL